MALIIPLRGYQPAFGKDCFLAENATIVGQVTMGDHCSVWFNAVVRGDVNAITIGNNTNIQDGAIIHYAGTPARKIKEIGEKNAAMMERIADNYLKYAQWY